jgi:exodeoxyribonuclease VII small subunit
MPSKKKEDFAQSGEMSFEDAFDRLVEVTERLEAGEGSLSEMTALFEEGIKLSKLCGGQLDQVERKVEILLGNEGEETAPFEIDQEETEEEV